MLLGRVLLGYRFTQSQSFNLASQEILKTTKCDESSWKKGGEKKKKRKWERGGGWFFFFLQSAFPGSKSYIMEPAKRFSHRQSCPLS